jgi:hypothetical protein
LGDMLGAERGKTAAVSSSLFLCGEPVGDMLFLPDCLAGRSSLLSPVSGARASYKPAGSLEGAAMGDEMDEP